MAIGVLVQSDKYGAAIAHLENDYMKGYVNSPKDMPAAFRFLDEFMLDKVGNKDQARRSTHLAFSQDHSRNKLECYHCVVHGYTRRNCLNQAKNNQRLNTPKVWKLASKTNRGKEKQDKAFIQTSQKKSQKKNEKSALGFAHIFKFDEKKEVLISHSLITIVNQDTIKKSQVKEFTPVYLDSDLDLVYLPDKNNMLGAEVHWIFY